MKNSEIKSDNLSCIEWQPAYSHEDGNLIKMFFNPALSRSCLYQRVTGYFSAGALVLAARGLDALIARNGRMQLIVGCTLKPEEIRKIDEGYKLRELLTGSLAEKLGICVDNPQARERIGRLSWMVANSFLDIKLALPKDEAGKIQADTGIYHAKAGILSDEQGNRLAFTGSINETEAGWTINRESFSVSCSWRGEWDLKRIEKTQQYFDLLWNNKAKTAEVIDFPEALRQELLKYLPPDGFPNKKPEHLPKSEEKPAPVNNPDDKSDGKSDDKSDDNPDEQITADDYLLPEERRQKVWAFIKNASARPDGTLIAVRTSTVDPWPHQLRAYKRMLDEWPFRLLIADEVGLGKTIEAGMIIRHAWISGLAKRICIMVPGGVSRQWQAELYEKFNILIPIYTGKNFLWPEHHFCRKSLKEKVGREQWTSQPLVIVSSHLMRRAERQKELIEAEKWDLLILDEAHHARRKGAGTQQEKGPNRLLKLMQQMKDKVGTLLLLTATPMQVHPVELWDLLQLLGLPPEWTALTFVNYFEAIDKNPDNTEFHRLARLFQATEKFFRPFPEKEISRFAKQYNLSRIKTRSLMEALREPGTMIPIKRLTGDQRKAGLAILKAGSPVRYRMSRHTRDLLRKYYKEGLLDTPIAVRDVRDLAVTLTVTERNVYESVENYISTTWQTAEPGSKNAVGFIMTVYRRRMASCFYALRRTLEKRLAGLTEHDVQSEDMGFEELEQMEEDLVHDDLADEVLSGDEAFDMEREALAAEEKESILALLQSVSALDTDTKAVRLAEELEKEFAKDYDSAIVFTMYTDTMDFLKDFLAEKMDVSIGCFSGAGGLRRDNSGSWQPCTKEQIKRFLRNGDIKILICTDAAGEGLNLQYCGVLINYDLPWNPMKVEQRIGRIDRIGQKYARIKIINMAYENTVEADVYFALSERIGLFNGVVGKLQPILSRIPKDFESAVLVPADQRERARYQIVSNVEQMMTEADGFDIDEVNEIDLEIPEFPAPPWLPSDMDTVLQQKDLLPPGIECTPKDPYSYELRIPGYKESARITTSPKVFDEHFENHQLLFPDSPLFQKIYDAGGVQEDTDTDGISNLSVLLKG